MFGTSPADYNDRFDSTLLSTRLWGVAEYVSDLISTLILGFFNI